MVKEYIYFVSYAHENGFGSIEITINHPITRYDQINEAIRLIEKHLNGSSAVIINFILLREE